MTILARVWICSLPGSNLVYFLTSKHNRTSKDGPAANAEDRKRGAITAVSQKPLPGRPAYKNAVTV